MEEIRVRFATNRNPLNTAEMFGNGFRDATNPARYVTGSIKLVHLAPDLPDNGWEPVPSSLEIDPPNEGDNRPLSERGTADLQADEGIVAFAREMGSRREKDAASFGLVLLPGFASTFRSALQRAAQVATAYGSNGMFCFSWPANGNVSLGDYREDQRDARLSAQAIAFSLARLFSEVQRVARPQRPRLSLVAHSMGVYALRHAIQYIWVSAPELLDQIVFEVALLAAGDDDDDTLSEETMLAPLLRIAERIAVYTADRDGALALSAVLNGRARLGQWGPRNLGALPRPVTRIDASAVSATYGDTGESHYRHQYYRLSKPVIRDIRQVLALREPDDIEPRNPHPDNPADGRGWILPYASAVGRSAEIMFETDMFESRFAPLITAEPPGEISAKEVSDDDPHVDPDSPAPAAPTVSARRWRAARSILVLLEKVNRRAPRRRKDSDGIIGDRNHCPGPSDHCPNIIDGRYGVVTAIDITHDRAHGCDAGVLAEAIRASRDPRVKYIIWNERIVSSYAVNGHAPWSWRAYGGANPHRTHVHISVNSRKSGPGGYDSSDPWEI